MQSIAQMREEVHASQANAKFNQDLEANIRVIKGNIAANYKHSFALYGGGNPEEMVKNLRSRGLTCSVNGSMVTAQL